MTSGCAQIPETAAPGFGTGLEVSLRMRVLIVAAVVGVSLVALIGPVGQVGIILGECSEADRARGMDLPLLAQAVKIFSVRVGRPPTEEEGLRSLVETGILEKLPPDPWDDSYRYQVQDGAVRIWSLGKDGAAGGQGIDADLEVWVPGQVSPSARERTCNQGG